MWTRSEIRLFTLRVNQGQVMFAGTARPALSAWLHLCAHLPGHPYARDWGGDIRIAH